MNQHDAQKKAVDTLRSRSPLRSVSEYLEGIRSGNRTLLSQAITLIESTSPAHQVQAAELVQAVLPYSGSSLRVGITGVPGVGKSTFIEAFGCYLLEAGKKVAVLAVDPTSPLSKGSILGDKTRMDKLASDARAFIRPSPSANTLGGVARTTKETLLLCEAAGFDVVLIETVGVGQSETAVHHLTDFFLLLMLSGAGDQLQGIKRGIMEMCDGLLITKADGDNRNLAQHARSEYNSALHLFPARADAWMPRVLTCSATEGEGIQEAWEMITAYEEWAKNRNTFQQRRAEQNVHWMKESVQFLFHEKLFLDPARKMEWASLEEQVRSGTLSPFAAADKILQLIAFRQP
jgi:LAO/AO transport system kinase